jgi:hypothetical protein
MKRTGLEIIKKAVESKKGSLSKNPQKEEYLKIHPHDDTPVVLLDVSITLYAELLRMGIDFVQDLKNIPKSFFLKRHVSEEDLQELQEALLNFKK